MMPRRRSDGPCKKKIPASCCPAVSPGGASAGACPLASLGEQYRTGLSSGDYFAKTIRDLVKTAQRVDQVNRRLLCDQYQRRQREIAALPAKRQALQRYAGKDLGIFVDHSR